MSTVFCGFFQQNALFPQPGGHPLEGAFAGAQQGVEMDAVRQLGEGHGVGGLAPGDELGHIVSAGKLERAGKLAVQRVLYDPWSTMALSSASMASLLWRTATRRSRPWPLRWMQ